MDGNIAALERDYVNKLTAAIYNAVVATSREQSSGLSFIGPRNVSTACLRVNAMFMAASSIAASPKQRRQIAEEESKKFLRMLHEEREYGKAGKRPFVIARIF